MAAMNFAVMETTNMRRPKKLQLHINAPDTLHPTTARLVLDFANALADKLARAQEKYGYTDGWATQAWADECRQHLREHVAKGDPLDAAAYCAFMWRRGWSTVSDDEEDRAARALIAEYREIWPGSQPAMPEAKRLARAVLMWRQ